MKVRKLLARLSVSLLVLVVLLGGGEISVRLFADVERPILVRDGVVGRLFLPSIEDDVYDRETDRRVPLRISELGLRGPSYALAAPPDVRRVAILGDSMVAAVNLEEEETLAGRLEALLSASHPEVRWEVMNCGIPGSNTGQELLLYRELVARLRPDLVLCGFFAGNDLHDNHEGFRSGPGVYFDLDEDGELVQLPWSAARVSLSGWLNAHSRLYLWQKDLSRRLRGRRAVARTIGFRDRHWVFAPDPPADIARTWEITAALLREMRREVEARGGSFGVVLVPCGEEVYRNLFDAIAEHAAEQGIQLDWDAPDRRLREICAAADLPFLSLTEALRAAAPSASSTAKGERLFHGGDGHWNARANDVSARRVHAFLTEQGPDGTSWIDAVLGPEDG